jgi:integrase
MAPGDPDWAALMGLCFYAGLRPSEAVAVRWEDFRFRDSMWFVNIARGCVEGRVDDTKTAGSRQSVPVAKQLFANCYRRGTQGQEIKKRDGFSLQRKVPLIFGLPNQWIYEIFVSVK